MNQDLVKLSELFLIKYGVNLELNKQERCSKLDPHAINFVSRTDNNNGVSAIVKRVESITPNPGNTISVATGGSVLASFVQSEPYYSGRDLFVLTPKREMNINEMLFYCLCIRRNRYKYNYGRQANKTLGDLLLPNDIPAWVNNTPRVIKPSKNPLLKPSVSLNVSQWKFFKYSELFTIERGKGERINVLDKSGQTPVITASDKNNGLTNWTNSHPLHNANVITVNRNGNSVAEAYFQPMAFSSSEDVHIFIPKFDINPYIALFFTTLIRKEKYRYNYGRKWGLQRMNESTIKLPVDNSGNPDFAFMERFIKSLSFSSSI